MRIFIQARMSSQRFPGKVLAPFRGEPIVRHVTRAAAAAIGEDRIAVLTSDRPSDDPLVAYLISINVPVLRGSLEDVWGRFRLAVERWPCERFMRICADSPLLNSGLLQDAIAQSVSLAADLITNVHPRTFPKGQSLEIINAATFLALDPAELTNHDREHVTPIFYRQRDRYRIVNLRSPNPDWSAIVTTVDTLDDLRRLEADDSTRSLDLRIAGIDWQRTRKPV